MNQSRPTRAQVVRPAGPRGHWAWWLLPLGVGACGLLWLIWRYDPQQLGLPMCGLYLSTGLYCPSCGATRATHQLLHGHLGAALRFNALWVLVLPLLLYLVASELCRLLRGRPLPGDPGNQACGWLALAGVIVLFFIARNLPYFPFTLLAPPS